jgi:hypothetical protein
MKVYIGYTIENAPVFPNIKSLEKYINNSPYYFEGNVEKVFMIQIQKTFKIIKRDIYCSIDKLRM